MAIKIERSEVTKITGKGVLEDINDLGIVIADLKTGDEETVLFSDIKSLVGKEVSISVVSKETEED